MSIDFGEGPRLHLGCGPPNKRWPPGIWVHADLKPIKGITLAFDATKTFPFKDNVFKGVYAGHFFEHFGWKTAHKILDEIHRVLRPGGEIQIKVPNAAKAAAVLQNENRTPLEELRALFTFYGDGGFVHKMAYTKGTMRLLLKHDLWDIWQLFLSQRNKPGDEITATARAKRR